MMLIDEENIKSLFIKEEYDKVIKIIEENLLIDKTNIFLLNTKGMAHAAKKEFKDSIACYEKCIAIDHTKYALYSNLGYSYMGLEDDERAIEHFASSIKILTSSDFIAIGFSIKTCFFARIAFNATSVCS